MKYRVIKTFWYRADSGEPRYKYECQELLTVGLFKKKQRWYSVTRPVASIEGSYQTSVYFDNEKEAVDYVKYLEHPIEDTAVVYETKFI